jgi:ubiquinone/menaquinone biosynthesis C-methylase UbiE
MEETNVIQRQYDEVIASRYDFDPQSVIGDSLDRAVAQIRRQQRYGLGDRPMNVLDLGIGTGRFLEKLRALPNLTIQPHGLDISQKMIDIAMTRIPDLVPAVDDATNLEAHFGSVLFDLVGTHFITGFVPMSLLAEKIYRKLDSGGFWSFVGGTKAGFPALQKKACSAPYKWLLGIKTLDVGDFVCNPADQAEVERVLEDHGFRVCECETFTPPVEFRNFRQFMDFAYFGGWLTPFLESMGLHRASPVTRAVMNSIFFPLKDWHSIVIALAQKP